MLVACIVNVFGNLFLVAGLHLDAAGAAIATVAAQAVSVVCAVIMLLKKHLPFKLCKADFRLNPQCRKFLSIGLPLALQEFLTQLSFLALCAFVNRLGLEASSGYGVACKIVNFAMLIPSALMQSMAAFVSQNIGAGSKKRARQSMFTGIGIGLAFGCAVFANAFAYLKGFAPETIATAVLSAWWVISTATTRLSGSWCRVWCRPCWYACPWPHEHPAQCEPDYDRSGRPYVHRRRNRAEHLLLLLL